MPGISYYCDFAGISPKIELKIELAQRVQLSDSRYETDNVLATRTQNLSFTAYEHYPKTVIEDKDLLIIVEGAIYGKAESKWHSELRELGELLFNRSGAKASDSVARWVTTTDGEYIVAIVDKGLGETCVFNDSMGRLPFFYYHSGNEVALFREHKFLHTIKPELRYDLIGIGQFLMFGYNMGTRTMSSNVARLLPASFLRISQRTKTVDKGVLHEWCLGDNVDKSGKIGDHAARLGDLFLSATANRVAALPHLRPLLGLSGGLDSRAVLLGLLKTGLEFSSHTNTNAAGTNTPDAVVAAQLAELFECDWRRYDLKPTELDAFLKVVRNQEGGSVAVMAISIASYKRLMQDFGAATHYFTGDGGGNVMYPILPSRKTESVGDLSKMTALTLYNLHPSVVSKLLRISYRDLIDSIEDAFMEYPEDDPKWKFAHFKIFGRAWRFIMEGEDRTRFYFWLGTPFWDVNLVNYVLRVPDEMKSKFRLYSEFLRYIDPRSLEIPYANVGGRTESLKSHIYSMLKSEMTRHPSLHRFARRIVGRRAGGRDFKDSKLQSHLSELISGNEMIKEYIDLGVLNDLMSRGLSQYQYYLLATILLKLELTASDFEIPKT